jgi:hypothetical protein
MHAVMGEKTGLPLKGWKLSGRHAPANREAQSTTAPARRASDKQPGEKEEPALMKWGHQRGFSGRPGRNVLLGKNEAEKSSL